MDLVLRGRPYNLVLSNTDRRHGTTWRIEMRRPETSEYAEYYGLYVNQVPDGDILELLDQGVCRTREALDGIASKWETFAYESGKWTLREVVGHMIDTERVFGYRALSVARQDPAALPGMDQDQWTATTNANSRPLATLLGELESLRRSSIALFEGFDEVMWDQRGIASGVEFSVRAFPFIIVGHEIHHLKVLEERYLKPQRGGA